MLFNICVTAPKRPIIKFTIDGQEYQYDGNNLTIEGKLKMVNDGEKGWKMWIYDSLSFVFNFINTTVDFCAVGHGGNGGRGYFGEDEYGGNGGRGGEVKNLLSQKLLVGDTISTIVGDDTSVSKNGAVILSPANAAGAAGGSGTSVTWGQEAHITWGTNGSNGSWAFNDETFDGIRYAPGGGGGGCPWTGWDTWEPGETKTAPGRGGQGNSGVGVKGIVLLRYK